MLGAGPQGRLGNAARCTAGGGRKETRTRLRDGQGVVFICREDRLPMLSADMVERPVMLGIKPPPSTISDLHDRRWWRRFLRYFVFRSFLVACVVAGIVFADAEVTESAIAAREMSDVQLLSKSISDEFGHMLSDLLFLARSDELQGYLAENPGTRIQKIATLLVDFSSTKQAYGQLHFLDTDGREIVRVDYHDSVPGLTTYAEHNGGKVADPAFLRQVSSLRAGEVYVSDFRPQSNAPGTTPSPYVKLVMPIFSRGGRERGIVILDYDGGEIFDRMRSAERRVHGGLALLNDGGVWTYDRAGESAAAMPTNGVDGSGLPRLALTVTGRNVSQRIRRGEQGQFEDGRSLITYQNMRPLVDVGAYAKRAGITFVHNAGKRDPATYQWTLLTKSDISLRRLAPFTGDPRSYLLLALLLLGIVASCARLASSEVRRDDFEAGLRESRRKLQQALVRERKINDFQKHFLSTISHELKTPFATIDSNAQMMLRLGLVDNEPGRERISAIRHSVSRVSTLIDRLLAAARRDAVALVPARTATDMAALIRDVVADESNATTTHVIRCHVDEVRGTAMVDPELMRQVLENLITNAVKYSPQADEVIVAARVDDDAQLHLQVTDFGMGIPSNEVDRVFERFYRASNVDDVVGTGIGLDFVKTIVEKHGGSVAIDSEVGKGTTVHVFLPHGTAPAENGEAPESVSARRWDSTSQGGGRRETEELY